MKRAFSVWAARGDITIHLGTEEIPQKVEIRSTGRADPFDIVEISWENVNLSIYTSEGLMLAENLSVMLDNAARRKGKQNRAKRMEK